MNVITALSLVFLFVLFTNPWIIIVLSMAMIAYGMVKVNIKL